MTLSTIPRPSRRQAAIVCLLSLPVIGALLGHTQPGTTQRYAHLAADPLRAASDAIGARIADAQGPKEKTG